MKRKRTAAGPSGVRYVSLSLVLLFLFSGAGNLMSQTLTGTTEEQRAKPRNPQYRPPVIPPYLRNKASNPSPAQQYFANPDGRSADDLLRATPTEKPKPIHPFVEAHTEEEFRKKQDRLYLERTYLPQFGLDLNPDSHNPFYGEPSFDETPAERAQTIFLLSAPFTFGFSYAAMHAYRQTHGWKSGLDGPQTGVVLSLGALLSGLITWYDYRRVWSTAASADLNRFAKQLQRTHGD